MKTNVYIITDKHGNVRMTRRIPDLGRGEVAFKMDIDIPDSCFRSPIIEAELKLDGGDLINAQATITYGNRHRKLQLEPEPPPPPYPD